MNREKIIEALNITINGLNLLRDEVENSTKETVREAVKEVITKEEPKETVVNDTIENGNIDVESLKAMKYNDFKKYASQLGVKCTGTRDEIMERILALDNTETSEVEEEKVEEEVPTKSDTPKRGKKLGKAKVVEPTKDEFDEQAEEIAKETDVKDIIDALADVDVKATTNNAVEKLAYALREGLIELDDEEEEEEEETEEEVEESVEESEDTRITEDSYFSQYDPEGFNDPKTMTKARAKAVKSIVAGILEQIEEEQIEEEDITGYLEDNCTEEELELLGDNYSDEDLIGFYIEMIKRTIDNDGEQHEPSDPYELGNTDMCCGHELKYSDKTKKYICEVCGVECEAED